MITFQELLKEDYYKMKNDNKLPKYERISYYEVLTDSVDKRLKQ